MLMQSCLNILILVEPELMWIIGSQIGVSRYLCCTTRLSLLLGCRLGRRRGRGLRLFHGIRLGLIFFDLLLPTLRRPILVIIEIFVFTSFHRIGTRIDYFIALLAPILTVVIVLPTVAPRPFLTHVIAATGSRGRNVLVAVIIHGVFTGVTWTWLCLRGVSPVQLRSLSLE
jgi:hypothetical protein